MLIEHMSEFPHCPYCGDRMELQVEMPDGGNDYTVWYQCVVCDSTSPFVQIPKGNTRTQIEKKALAAAITRQRSYGLPEHRADEDIRMAQGAGGQRGVVEPNADF